MLCISVYTKFNANIELFENGNIPISYLKPVAFFLINRAKENEYNSKSTVLFNEITYKTHTYDRG